MSYEIELSQSTEKDLDKLGNKTYDRILSKILALADDPKPPQSIKLTNREQRRIRIGDYRVLYEINEETQSIWIVSVGHRKEVYR